MQSAHELPQCLSHSHLLTLPCPQIWSSYPSFHLLGSGYHFSLLAWFDAYLN